MNPLLTEIDKLQVVTQNRETKVLEAFEQFLVAQKYMLRGGEQFARGALEKVMGPRKAQALLDRVRSTGSSGFLRMQEMSPGEIAAVLREERAETIALALSRVDATRAIGVFHELPGRVQAEVAACGDRAGEAAAG